MGGVLITGEAAGDSASRLHDGPTLDAGNYDSADQLAEDMDRLATQEWANNQVSNVDHLRAATKQSENAPDLSRAEEIALQNRETSSGINVSAEGGSTGGSDYSSVTRERDGDPLAGSESDESGTPSWVGEDVGSVTRERDGDPLADSPDNDGDGGTPSWIGADVASAASDLADAAGDPEGTAEDVAETVEEAAPDWIGDDVTSGGEDGGSGDESGGQSGTPEWMGEDVGVTNTTDESGGSSGETDSSNNSNEDTNMSVYDSITRARPGDENAPDSVSDIGPADIDLAIDEIPEAGIEDVGEVATALRDRFEDVEGGLIDARNAAEQDQDGSGSGSGTSSGSGSGSSSSGGSGGGSSPAGMLPFPIPQSGGSGIGTVEVAIGAGALLGAAYIYQRGA